MDFYCKVCVCLCVPVCALKWSIILTCFLWANRNVHRLSEDVTRLLWSSLSSQSNTGFWTRPSCFSVNEKRKKLPTVHSDVRSNTGDVLRRVGTAPLAVPVLILVQGFACRFPVRFQVPISVWVPAGPAPGSGSGSPGSSSGPGTSPSSGGAWCRSWFRHCPGHIVQMVPVPFLSQHLDSFRLSHLQLTLSWSCSD